MLSSPVSQAPFEDPTEESSGKRSKIKFESIRDDSFDAITLRNLMMRRDASIEWKTRCNLCKKKHLDGVETELLVKFRYTLLTELSHNNKVTVHD